MFLLFFLFIFEGESQTLMMDSRNDKRKNLNLFHESFSIWFTYYNSQDPEYINLFSIINKNNLLMKI